MNHTGNCRIRQHTGSLRPPPLSCGRRMLLENPAYPLSFAKPSPHIAFSCYTLQASYIPRALSGIIHTLLAF